MVTEKQLAANRQNALKSTGPHTLDGKAKASKNALKHGLLSSEVLLEDDSREQFEQFGERLLTDLSPEGELECMLADRIIAACWRLQRTVRIEREMMDADLGEGAHFGPKHSATNSTLGRCVAMDMAEHNTYGKLCRYEAHIERGLYKALHELQRLQAARTGLPVLAPVAVDVDVTGVQPENN